MKIQLKFIAVLFGLLTPILSFATSEVYLPLQNLREEAVLRFLVAANSPITRLGQLIVQHNLDTTDGRNPDGTIEMPVTEEALSVTIVNGQEMLNPFHYAERDNGICRASGDSAQILIALRSIQGVHAAAIYDSLLFTTEMQEQLSFASNDTSEEANCRVEYFEGTGGEIRQDFENTPFTRIELPASR
jgi:hypothetical protein